MPACNLVREVMGTVATWRTSGRFEASCAWELAGRLQEEALPELVVDFSQVNDFVDYGVAVLSSALLSLPDKRVHLQGLRQHQLRVFKYFGIDPDALAQRNVAHA